MVKSHQCWGAGNRETEMGTALTELTAREKLTQFKDNMIQALWLVKGSRVGGKGTPRKST